MELADGVFLSISNTFLQFFKFFHFLQFFCHSMSQAIYRVYRPATFAELTGQNHVSLTIQNQFTMGQLAHAYLFTGPRGVGKTTTARLVAKLANCENPVKAEPCNVCPSCVIVASGSSLDVYEIDAASNTDVENVRENIIKSVRFAPNQLKKKIYIIDEVHMLSTSAFNALLKTLEEPPAHVLFILATTEIHKVPETIISRCQRFDFRRIPKEEMLARLKGIILKEEVDVETEVLEQIVKQSEGCARDAESLLQQILALGEKKITIAEASLVLPMNNSMLVNEFIASLFARDASACIQQLNTNLEQGLEIKSFLNEVIDSLRETLLSQLATGKRNQDQTFIRDAITGFLEARAHIRSEHLPQLPVELAIVELCLEERTEKTEMTERSKRVETKKEHFKQQGVDLSRVSDAKEKKEIAEEVRTVLEIHEAIVPEEIVFDTIPVLSLDDVRQKWPQVFDQIKECNASLPLFMQSCEVSQVSNDQVELAFEYDLYVQTVNKEKNRLVIEQVLKQVLGRSMRVRAVAAKPKIVDETLSTLIGEFGGSIV